MRILIQLTFSIPDGAPPLARVARPVVLLTELKARRSADGFDAARFLAYLEAEDVAIKTLLLAESLTSTNRTTGPTMVGFASTELRRLKLN
jgi:hypothetical protein